jgi:hypothetical protein
MLLKQNCNLGMAVVVLSDGVAGGAAHSLTHLARCLTMVVAVLVHEGNTGDLGCCLQGCFHMMLQMADRASHEVPPYAVEI